MKRSTNCFVVLEKNRGCGETVLGVYLSEADAKTHVLNEPNTYYQLSNIELI